MTIERILSQPAELADKDKLYLRKWLESKPGDPLMRIKEALETQEQVHRIFSVRWSTTSVVKD